MNQKKTFVKRIALRLFVSTVALLSFVLTTNAQQQQSWSPVDNGRTAAFVMSSATAMDEINLYNGRVSLKIPIGTIGARGQASYQPTVSISRTFVLRRVNDWMQGSGQWSQPVLQLIAENYQDSYDYSDFQPGLLPAVMFGRKTRNANPGFSGSVPPCSKVTKIYVRLPGSQVELRDNLTGGEPDSSFMLNRGRDWHSVDGSGMFFKSDTDISDETCSDNQWLAMNGGNVIYPTGYLMMKDGTRYRFVQGMPIWMRDRNGNTIKFGSTVTDSINRQYSLTGGSFTYTAVDGTARTVSVIQGPLSSALRSDFAAGGVKTEAQLFPSVSGQLRCPNCAFSPNVVTSIRLPNNLEYKFFYNTYGEVARIEMPSGGVVEYDYDGYVPAVESPQILRYITVKRVYSAPGVLAARQTFAGFSPFDQVPAREVKTFDAANNLIRYERHYFKGGPLEDFFFTGWYQAFDNGQETAVEILNATGSVLERTDNTYNTLDMNGNPTTLPSGVSTHPTNLDCALVETKVTLSESNQINRTAFTYDGRANQTDIYEYDIGTAGSGVAGPLVRRSHTDFVTDTAYTSTAGPYIINLPSQQWISSDAAGTNKLSLNTFEYDTYNTDSRHAGLLDRPSIAGLCLKLDDTNTNCLQVSDTLYIQRGNVTQTNAYSSVAGGVIVRNSTQFDIAGNQVKTIDGRLNATTINYDDAFGVADGEARANLAPSQLGTLKAFAFATSTTNALNQHSYVQYNFNSGFPVDQEDPNGVITSLEYGLGGVGGADPLDRISKVIKATNSAPVKTATSYVYDDTNHMITTTNDLVAYDDKLLKEEKIYDGLGRFIETRKYESPTTYLTTKFDFDPLGRAKRTYNPYRTTGDETYGWTDTSYDLLGRTTITQTFDRLGNSTGLTQNAYNGPQTLITDQAGKKQLTESGVLGIMKVWEIAPADGATTTTSFLGQSLTGYLTVYEYDGRGKLTKVTQGTQAPRVLAYDGLARLTDTTFPENGHVSYGYDGSGNPNSKTDARSVVTTMVYDPLNRLQTKSYSDGTPTFTYSYDTATYGVGRLASVSSSVSSYAMSTYDALGRATSSSQTVDGTTYTMSYQYNRAGALTSQTYPSGKTISNEYDGGGRVVGVRNQASGFYYAGAVATDTTNRIQYSSFGKMQAIKLGNGLWEHNSFNSRSQAVQIALGTSITDTSKLKLDFTYGVVVNGTLDTSQNNANVQSQTITMTGLTLAQTYTYDDLNRLKSATEMNGANQTWKQTYDYDRFGNRTFNTTPGNTTLPVINPSNQDSTNPAISAANNQISATGYGYDQGGNLKCDPEHPCVSGVAYYAYNPENLLKTTGGGSGSGGTSYFYDANGRRVKKVVGTTTTVFVYDVSGKLLAEYSDAQPTAGGTNYITADHLGSSRAITDSSGNVKGRHDFLPYGEEVDVAIGSRNTVPGYSATDSLRQKFTAKERDLETGFDFFKARYYASKYGRFTSIDPLDASAKQTEPDTWNRYVYVTNNPLRFIDQDGQIKKDSNGKYVERVIGDKKYTHDGAPRVDFESTEVRLQTDDGQREIEAKRRPGASFDNNTGTLNINEKRTSADCHGLTFTEGKYWINDNQVQTILDHDNYKALGSGDKAVVGDVAVYRNASGGVVHSATVTQVDSRGQPTKVEGVGGLAMDSKATTPATQFATTDQAVAAGLPASAGYASVTYYHKQGESARDREKRVQAVTNFTKR